MLVSSVMYKYDEAIQDSGIMEMVQLYGAFVQVVVFAGWAYF